MTGVMLQKKQMSELFEVKFHQILIIFQNCPNVTKF